jgi:hypothetical protein
MKFAQPHCPDCGEIASHILEAVYCHTPISFGADGESSREDTSKILWETSDLLCDEPESQVTLHCNQCLKSWTTSTA